MSAWRPVTRARRPAAGVLAMPAECRSAPEAQDSEDALRTVVLALARDLSALVARLKTLVQDDPGHASSWNGIVGSLRRPTVAQVAWMVDALHAAQVEIEHAARAPDEDAPWQQAGRHYEAALLGAQALAVWVSWLDFAKQLSTVGSISVEVIVDRLLHTWTEMEPVLVALQSGERARIRGAARSLQHHLPAWSQALYAWGKQAERDIRELQRVLLGLSIVQAAFDLATMRHVIGPLLGRGAGGGGFGFVLPGIGGITAGGAATGVRVVISAEWLRAMEHLIAIGAIASPEIVQIAGVSSLASAPVPRPARPAVPPDGRGAAGSSTTSQQRPVRVLVQHRAGNRQVEVNGQRWHLPKGKSPKDIPAADPVGDRLQAEVKKIAGKWGPGKLAPRERFAINKARAAGKRWLARLLERQARGRWVESQAREAFKTEPQLEWNNRGVDVVDRNTSIMYEVLSGTAKNMNHHARRMAKEMFRMITF